MKQHIRDHYKALEDKVWAIFEERQILYQEYKAKVYSHREYISKMNKLNEKADQIHSEMEMIEK